MKINKTLALAGILILGLATSCNINPVNVIASINQKVIKCKGESITKTMKADNFTELDVSGNIDVKYTTGPVSIKLQAPSDAMEYIDLSVKDGKLVMAIKANYSLQYPKGKEATLTVSSPELNKVTTRGTGDVKVDNLTGESIGFYTFGTGDIKSGILTSRLVELMTYGTGGIEVAGVEGSNLIATTSGTGDIHVKNAMVTDITANTSGTGDIEIKGKCDKANLSTSGTGDIEVRNLTAKQWNVSESGTGDVER